MQPASASMRTILVDEQVFEVLARTAETRDTDINGVLKYLLEAPAVTTGAVRDDDEE